MRKLEVILEDKKREIKNYVVKICNYNFYDIKEARKNPGRHPVLSPEDIEQEFILHLIEAYKKAEKMGINASEKGLFETASKMTNPCFKQDQALSGPSKKNVLAGKGVLNYYKKKGNPAKGERLLCNLSAASLDAEAPVGFEETNVSVQERRYSNLDGTPDMGFEQEVEASVDVETMLKSLKPLERAIIKAKVLEGFQIKEIAEMLKMKPNTVTKKFNRACEKLRPLFAEYANI